MHKQRPQELTGRRRELLDALPALRRFALSLAGNREAADELLHCTVRRVLKRGLPVEAELAPWCIRACRQVWMEERQTGSDSAGAASWTPTNEQQGRASASAGEVQSALAALSDDQRAVLELVAVEGRSYGAAAAMLDLPIGRVMSRLVRARGALMERCRSDWPAPPERRAVNHE